MVRLKLMLLGGLDVRLASGGPLSLPTKKALALLAYLGTRPGQSHTRDKLASLLWGEKSDDHARGGLRQALAALRRALASVHPPPLRIEGQTLTLNADGVDVDVAAFEHLVGQGTPQALEQAAELYRGDLLSGLNVNEPLFEEWLVAERERLREMALEALARLLAHQTKNASSERAIQTALRLLGLDPSQEAVHRTLMQLYARQGRRGAALKQYQVCLDVLRRELGTAPEPETRKLYQELLRRPAEPSQSPEDLSGRRSRPAPKSGAAPPDLPAAETPLIGRQAEVERLRQFLAATLQGQGQVASIVGEAGIGKTRLVSALASEALAREYQVLIGRCHESDSILAFGPWVDACRNGRLSADEDILNALHPTRRAELARLFPEADVAGLPPASDASLALFESMADLIERAALRAPLVLVLEDLHWADEMTLRLVGFVSRRIPTWRAFLVATAREEELADAPMARQTLGELSRASQTTSVMLAPLSRPDTALLVRALTRVGRDAPTMAGVEERIWTMSEGNPFVAVEAMRALDQGSLRDGALEATGALALPASVRELVARRLDRLSARGQRIAGVAAVIGRMFDFTLLQSASDMEERDAAEAVEELVRDHVLQAVGNQLDFTHDRIRDVAYGRLLPPRRLLLHRAVAAALEIAGSHGDRPAERIEQLAHHAVRGELKEKAVLYLRGAGDKAVARSALQDARAWFEQALDSLQTLPQSQSVLEAAFDIRLALRPVLTQLSELPRVLALLREAEGLAEQLNDERRRGRVWAFMTNIHSLLGELDIALVSGERALEIAGRLDDLRLRIPTTTYLEVAHYWRGDHARVVELATNNLAALPADWNYECFGSTAPASVYDRSFLVMSLAELGRFDEADAHTAEAIRLAEPTQHGFTISLAYRAACTLHLRRGSWSLAQALITRWTEVVRTANVILHRPYLVAASAWLLAKLGQTGPALDLVREGEQLVGRIGVGVVIGMNGWSYHAQGRACLLLGHLDEARRWCERAIEFSAGQHGFMATALHLLGDIASHLGQFDPEVGEANYRQALALAEPRGMRPLVAHCHHGLGDLYARTGESEKTREHLDIAAGMYRDMDMRFWLEQVTRQSR